MFVSFLLAIILSWNINVSFDPDSILSYQLFSYEETGDPPSTDSWQKIGTVKALELPMACTLTQVRILLRRFVPIAIIH